MKKIGLLFATIVMIMMFAMSASAIEPTGQCGENVYWNFDKNTGEFVVSGQGAMWNYTSSSMPFSGIDIKTVVIESGVTEIGNHSFDNCYYLKSVTIPNTVTRIGISAFSCSSLNNVLIPDSVTNIDDYAFSSCGKLVNVTLSNSVTNIGNYAFHQCNNLVSITIPDSVTSIGFLAFAPCNNLSNITVDENNKYFSSDSYGVLFNKERTELIRYPVGNRRPEYTIPSSVTDIENDAFYNCINLTNIIIPSSVTNIEETAFYNCTNLTVDEKNKYYSSDASGVLFNKDKTSLIQYPIANKRTEYAIPDSVTRIDGKAFKNCINIKKIVIPYGVTSIGYCTFLDCKNLSNVVIPASVKVIHSWAFRNCESLTSIFIPDSVTHIGDAAFAGCKSLTAIMVDENNKYYSNDEYGVLFNKEKTELIQYPAGNSNTRYVIPNGTSSLNQDSFDWCENLTKVVIPDSIKHIEESVFDVGLKLTDVYYNGNENQWEQIVIERLNDEISNTKIHFNHSHIYVPTLTLPPCMVQKNVVFMCECGDNYVGDYIDITNEHVYSSKVTISATHLKEGIETYSCVCGDTYTKSIAKLTEHNYTSQITKQPTHFEEGIKILTCECGDTYTKPVAKLAEHTYTAEITKQSTHKEEGVKTFTCACGDSYQEAIAKTKEHSYVVLNIVEPTCEAEGYITYTCECGHTYNGDKKAATGHNYEGDNCKICGESKIENCNCNCHKGGISGFFWKLLRFFYKLFSTNKTCGCGVSHY